MKNEGNASKKSVKRPKTPSTFPRKYPAITPIIKPIKTVEKVVIAATKKDVRAPYISRASKS